MAGSAAEKDLGWTGILPFVDKCWPTPRLHDPQGMVMVGTTPKACIGQSGAWSLFLPAWHSSINHIAMRDLDSPNYGLA